MLSEPAWQTAHKITGLTQNEPKPGDPASEVTQVAVLYTHEELYVGVWCFDRDPGAIIANEMRRDADLDANDRILILLDTFRDRRNAFYFIVGPAGGRLDGLIADNGASENEQFDAVWQARTTITSEGWFAEIAIPFQSLSFKQDQSTWGFNVQRVIKRRQEFDRWASPTLDASFFQPARAGDLTGLHDLHQGLGIDIQPFGTLKYLSDRIEDDRDLTPDAGGDVFWRVTPSFTAILTVNTDFAETEVDTRQINLTRFPLFFPEKRDFFLEDAGIFSFAGTNEDTALVPFFSRRIGLAGGEAIPVRWGLKGVGRAGDYNIGVLDVETGANADVSERNLAVARLSRNVFDQSDVGFIATRGNPIEGGMNALFGVDYNYRTSDFAGDKTLRTSVYALHTYTTDFSGDDKAYGLRLVYPNDLWSGHFAYQVIETDFNPALGFVERTGVKNYATSLQYEPRLDDGVIRQLKFGIEPQLITDTANDLDSWAVPVQVFGFELHDGDELEVLVTPRFETFDSVFEIADSVLVPPGDYRTLRESISVSSALKRPATVEASYATGTFLTGRLDEYSAAVTWRASRYLRASVGYEQNDVRLPEGDFTTRVALVRTNVSMSPDLSWSMLAQYDSESRLLGLNSRMRYIIEDGRELFLVYNHGWLRPEGRSAFATQTAEAILKLGYSFRF